MVSMSSIVRVVAFSTLALSSASAKSSLRADSRKSNAEKQAPAVPMGDARLRHLDNVDLTDLLDAPLDETFLKAHDANANGGAKRRLQQQGDEEDEMIMETEAPTPSPTADEMISVTMSPTAAEDGSRSFATSAPTATATPTSGSRPTAAVSALMSATVVVVASVTTVLM